MAEGEARQHVPAKGRIDYAAATEAFELFAGGELTIFDTHGAPNGLNIFSFAELTLVLIAFDQDRDVWGELLPIFGRACEIFLGSDHLCGAPRTFCSYRVSHNPKGARAPSPQTKQDIRLRWENAVASDTATERLTLLIHAALFDDMPVAGSVDIAGETVAQPIALLDTGC